MAPEVVEYIIFLGAYTIIYTKEISNMMNIFYFIYFISFIGHRNSRLQGERPMGLVQTGKRDPCKAQPLNKSITR